jgi:hypothetical protein
MLFFPKTKRYYNSGRVLEARQLFGDDSRTIPFVTGQDPLLTSEKYVSNLQHGLKED